MIMKNQQEGKKSDFFFAYGSPQFVLGATLFNMFLNSDSKTRGSIFNLLSILGLSVIFGFIILISIFKINERVFTPSYSVNGYIGSWDWKNNGNSYEINNDKVKFSIYHNEVDSLPTPSKMKELIDNSISIIQNQTKGFELKKITMEYKWISSFPSLRHCLVMNIDYISSEGKDDFVWNGKEYVAVKVKGDLSKTFEFDTYTLK